MGRRDDVLSRHSGAIRQAAARHKADSIALVGSVARGDDSDYGFVADFAEGASLFGRAGLQLDLRELLGRDVDVVSVGALTVGHQSMLDDAITL